MSKPDKFFWNLSSQEGKFWIFNAKLKLFKQNISRVLHKSNTNKHRHRLGFWSNSLCKPYLKHQGFNHSSTVTEAFCQVPKCHSGCSNVVLTCCQPRTFLYTSRQNFVLSYRMQTQKQQRLCVNTQVSLEPPGWHTAVCRTLKQVIIWSVVSCSGSQNAA